MLTINRTTCMTEFNPNDFFKEYHYFELFDPNKEYIEDRFTAVYKEELGQKTYKFFKHELSDDYYGYNEIYVVAHERLSNQERDYLKQYCQCAYHRNNWFCKIFMSKKSVKCLDTNRHSQQVINKTREYIKNQK
jgi:hypothetical protein